ncbi:alkaline phosphatase [Paenibacillus sp. XY044]|uniref:alkaline phosphatase n=1 Tax=Paenibacillus sp. XY044 TaxID=2026089 RepID=UPI000B97DAEB|nr:alkaline phosphatase [Paenibacillus sp. XY044]OZB93471.1 alkaline phosphatase [Paenibacillus sp. XY044]
MKRSKRLVQTAFCLSAAASLIFTGSVSAQGNSKAPSQNAGKAKNVILFVGDGMGTAARDAIRLSTVGVNGKLQMDDMPYVGLLRTHSTTTVTDSAAAGTAIASGVKTYNGAVGVDANKKPVKTLLEIAKENGKSTGLVTTSQITDATPAAFASHVEDRSKQSDIAKQYLEKKVDVLLGGGEDFWYPQGTPGPHPDQPAEDPTEGSKGTQGNLVEKAKQLGYQFVTNKEELSKAKNGRILGLFANEEMFQQREEGQGDLYNPTVPLVDMTKKALDTLSTNKKGFFLMVEEEGTDEMAHENNAKLTIKAGQELDKAVGAAKEFAKKNPDTLVLVLADHETGGLTIEEPDDKDESGDGISKEDGPFAIANSKDQFYVDWTTSGHSGVDVPLTAMGSRAELFAGVYENTYVHDAILKAWGIKK